MNRSRTTPGAPARGLEAQGARPPDPPPTPQCLFQGPPENKNGQVTAQIDSEAELLATVCSILLPTYTETDVQHWFCPPVVQEADALLRARVAGWLDQNEFEKAILQLFVLSVRTEGKSPSTRRLQVGPPADHLPYSVEETLEDDCLTVPSLVVQITLPEHIQTAAIKSFSIISRL